MYVWTAPGPDVKGVLALHLASGGSGCFHSAQGALVSDRASVLFAADVAGRWRTREGEIKSWVTPGSQVPRPGAGHAEPQASGPTHGARETAVAHWRQAGDHHTGVFM